MSSPNPFSISQGLEVLQPKSGPAFPIPCAEWEQLITRLTSVSHPPVRFETGGSILGGASLSTLITILTGTFSGNGLVVAWAVVVVTGICGGAMYWLGSEHRKVQHLSVRDIIQQMRNIDQRYERPDHPTASIAGPAAEGLPSAEKVALAEKAPS